MSGMAANEARHSSTIQEQVNKLKMTTDKISKAFDGLDVDWSESNSQSWSASSMPTTSEPTVASVVDTTTTTTTTPEPSLSPIDVNSSGASGSDETEVDENTLPLCPVTTGDTSEGESEDQNSKNSNQQQQTGEEFGSGDGEMSESDDESSGESDDSSEDEEEEETESEPSSESAPSSAHSSKNTSPAILSASGSESEETSPDQQPASSTSTRGWYQGKPCRMPTSPSTDLSAVDTQSAPTSNVNLDNTPDIMKNTSNSLDTGVISTDSDSNSNNNNGADLSRQPPNSLDDSSYSPNKIRLEIGTFSNDNSPPPVGSSASSPYLSGTMGISLVIPLLVATTLSLVANTYHYRLNAT